MTPTERDSASTEPHDGAPGDAAAREVTEVSTDGAPASPHVARVRASLAWALDEYAQTLAKLAK
jgi:hypothetical protein